MFDGFGFAGLLTLDNRFGVFSGFELVGGLIPGEIKLPLDFRLAFDQVMNSRILFWLLHRENSGWLSNLCLFIRQ